MSTTRSSDRTDRTNYKEELTRSALSAAFSASSRRTAKGAVNPDVGSSPSSSVESAEVTADGGIFRSNGYWADAGRGCGCGCEWGNGG